MQEILATVIMFMLKTLLNFTKLTFINPFIILLAVYFYKKRSLLNILTIIISLFILAIFLTGNIFLLTCNYLVILPIFLLAEDNFFESILVKIILQGSLAILVFFTFRFFLMPVNFLALLQSVLWTEIFLILLSPLYKLLR